MHDHDLSPAEKRRQLLKRGKKGLIHLVFSRTGIVTLLLLLQLGLMLLVALRFEEYLMHYYSTFSLLSFAIVIWLLNSDTDPNAKITRAEFVEVARNIIRLMNPKDFGQKKFSDVSSSHPYAKSVGEIG